MSMRTYIINKTKVLIAQKKPPTTSHIVYLDPKGKLIDRVNIPGT